MRILGRSPQGFLIPLLLLAAGCATSRHFTAGETAERLGRYDDAVVHYARAVAEDPSDSAAALSLTRAKLRAAEGHAREAERLAAQQDYPGAEDALRAAIILAPSETSYQERLAIIQEAVEGQAEETRALTLAELKKEALTRPLGLDMPEDARAPASFVFRDASLRYVLLTIGEIAGVNVAFDEDFVDQSVSIEAEESSFEDAIRSLTETTGHFFRVESPHLITIVPDTQNKRLQYERQVAQTFYLSSADLTQTADTLRIVLGIRQIASHEGTNSITMVDTWEQVRSAQRIIEALDRSPGEVVVDVELMEVNRTHLEQYGIPLLSAGAEGIAAALTPRLDTILQNPYERGNLQITGLPGAILNLVRSDSDTHVLANPQLRASDGKPALADFGETGSGSGDHLRSVRGRRTRPAADHDVRVRKRRGQHRGASPDPPRRQRDAGDQGPPRQRVGHRVFRAADLREPERGDDASPPERRDQHDRRPHPSGRAEQPERASRSGRHTGDRAVVRPELRQLDGVRHHPDHHPEDRAARRSRPGGAAAPHHPALTRELAPAFPATVRVIGRARFRGRQT